MYIPDESVKALVMKTKSKMRADIKREIEYYNFSPEIKSRILDIITKV